LDGMHDLGGLADFGPVLPEPNEPVFHAAWERRVFALNMAGLAFVGPVDRARHAIERMNPVEYLTTSYYEHWLYGIAMLVEELGYVSAQELATGRARGQARLPHPAPDAAMVEGLVRHGMPAVRDIEFRPAFAVGEPVRARHLETRGHTRLPRYVRGKVGTVIRCNGCHAFPDTAAHDLGENPQPLYNVRFEARELWGDNVTRRDCVYIDLWESYLQPLDTGEPPS
jgi:nitrile hydratase subunit beta